jgi:nicotinamidase-related amidase
MSKALLVIDLQNGVGPLFDFENVIRNVNQRISDFREKGDPIIFVQHTCAGMAQGSEPWQFVSELAINADDKVIAKTQGSAFYKTTLQQTLDDLNVTSLEICGAQTEYCVDATLKAAFYEGYKVTVTPNAFSTVDSQNFPALKINVFYKKLWSEIQDKSPLT